MSPASSTRCSASCPALGSLTRLEAATGGDEWTVRRGGLRGGEGPEPWSHVHGAGLRLVADLADPEATLAVIATGQSGHPLSAHWGDLLAGLAGRRDAARWGGTAAAAARPAAPATVIRPLAGLPGAGVQSGG